MTVPPRVGCLVWSYRTNISTDIDIFLYVDDFAILANSREELQYKFNLLCVYVDCKDRNLKTQNLLCITTLV